MSVIPEARLLRHGLAVSAISIVWTIVVSTITVILGLSEQSAALTAFGLTGLLDAAGSAALVVHFRHSIKHDTFSEKHERIAFLTVTIGLVVVAVATMAGSLQRLIAGDESGHSTLGLTIAAVSVFVLFTLATIKRQVGKAIPSAALSADGALSFTGSFLAAITVAGTVLAAVGFSWADPVAAIAIAIGALIVVVILHKNNK